MVRSEIAFSEQRLAAVDRDHYLAALYAPREKRDHLFALYAFNAEIESIATRVREPLPGEIRLQWWRDVLTGGSYSGEGVPLADGLLAAIRGNRLPQTAFEAYLDARISDLYADPFGGRADLEAYFGQTASTIIQLACLILDEKSARLASDAAGHGGCAMGVAKILSALPQHRARGKCCVPLDILAAAGMDAETFLAGDDKDRVAAAVEMMLSLGREHLTRFEAAAKRLPASVRPALLPVATTSIYLRNVDPADPFQRRQGPSELRRQIAMIRRALFGW